MVELHSRDDDNYNLGCLMEDTHERNLEDDREITEDDGIGDAILDSQQRETNKEKTRIFIEKKGTTTRSLSMEIMPSLTLAEQNAKEIDKDSIVIVNGYYGILTGSEEEKDNRIAQLNPQGIVIIQDIGEDSRPLSLYHEGKKQKSSQISCVSIDGITVFRLFSLLREREAIEEMYRSQEDTVIDGKTNIMLMDPFTFQTWKKAWKEVNNIGRKDPLFDAARMFVNNQSNLDACIIFGGKGPEQSSLSLFRPSSCDTTIIHRLDNGYADEFSIPLVNVSKYGTRLELKLKK